MTRQIKFRVRDIETNEIIGYEWIEDGRWNFNLYFKKDSRYGVFNKIHKREQLVHIKPDGTELYEGDRVRYKDKIGILFYAEIGLHWWVKDINGQYWDKINWDELDLIKEEEK